MLPDDAFEVQQPRVTHPIATSDVGAEGTSPACSCLISLTVQFLRRTGDVSSQAPVYENLAVLPLTAASLPDITASNLSSTIQGSADGHATQERLSPESLSATTFSPGGELCSPSISLSTGSSASLPARALASDGSLSSPQTVISRPSAGIPYRLRLCLSLGLGLGSRLRLFYCLYLESPPPSDSSLKSMSDDIPAAGSAVLVTPAARRDPGSSESSSCS